MILNSSDREKPEKMQPQDKLKIWLKKEALALGFSALKITSAELPDETQARLSHFIEQDYHGTMSWLAETAPRRGQPTAMWPAAKSALLLAMNYGPDHDPMDNLTAGSKANISVYARGRDYHDVIKGKLKMLASKLVSRAGAEVKVFVDTAPLMEKPLAQQAGLGWQGKHTNLVSRELGSWFFIGAILTDAELVPDHAETDHCGSCSACLDICPTRAFPAPYQLDARRCISYLTIEYDGVIEPELRAQMGNRIFGCDDCLAVCPWNKFAEQAHEQKLLAKSDEMPDLAEMLLMDEPSWRQFFAGQPVRRTGYIRFLRNCLIAAGNSKDNGLVPVIAPYLHHSAPSLRSMAVWAYRQLTGGMPARDDAETDQMVLAEYKR